MRYLIAFTLSLFLFSSCVKNNPDPSWLEVNEWTLIENSNATPGIAGELTHNFNNAWVYVDGELLGVFEVPFKIPVLKTGNVNIKLLPTILDNGISATKKVYPFTETYSVNVTLNKNQVTTINPVTKYFAATKFWKEDFGDPAIKIDEDLNNTAHMVIDNSAPILKWGPCGRISMNKSDSLFLAYTNVPLALSKGYDVYLEIDYYNTNSLTTGVVSILPDGSSTNNANIRLNAQAESDVKWKKIYISLKEIVSYSTNATTYKISLYSLFDSSLATSDIYIDNIKIVY